MDERGTKNTLSYRTHALEILADPAQEIPTRAELAVLLGISRKTLYENFNSDDLAALYKEAMAIRRARITEKSAEVDEALVRLALAGDVQAIKLFYQRHEGWAPATTITGEISHKIPIEQRLLELEEQGRLALPDPEVIDVEVEEVEET